MYTPFAHQFYKLIRYTHTYVYKVCSRYVRTAGQHAISARYVHAISARYYVLGRGLIQLFPSQGDLRWANVARAAQDTAMRAAATARPAERRGVGVPRGGGPLGESPARTASTARTDLRTGTVNRAEVAASLRNPARDAATMARFESSAGGLSRRQPVTRAANNTTRSGPLGTTRPGFGTSTTRPAFGTSTTRPGFVPKLDFSLVKHGSAANSLRNSQRSVGSDPTSRRDLFSSQRTSQRNSQRPSGRWCDSGRSSCGSAPTLRGSAGRGSAGRGSSAAPFSKSGPRQTPPTLSRRLLQQEPRPGHASCPLAYRGVSSANAVSFRWDPSGWYQVVSFRESEVCEDRWYPSGNRKYAKTQTISRRHVDVVVVVLT